MLEVDVALRRGSFHLEAKFASGAPIVALFGRSGSGKTSLVNAIAGIDRPERGRIVIGGRVLYDSATGVDLPPEKRRVGYVFQDALLFPHLDVRANLAYGEALTPVAERFVERQRILDLLGLEPLLRRRVANLSGGEKQRVAIGRALLLDEPLASLDGARKAEILAYIEILRDELRLPIVYVSHALEEVTRLADRVVVVADGRTLVEGTAAEVLSRPGLATLTGRFEAGSVIDARVRSHDATYELTTLDFPGGELVVPNLDALPGAPVRVRIRARDVSLALTCPMDVSIQNIFAARVVEMPGEFGAILDVSLAVGSIRILARITRKAAAQLGLAPGMEVFALVKAVSIDRHSVGFA